jgi:hypothetical protein
MCEQWKEIPSLGGKYAACPCGQIKGPQNRPLKQATSKTGYKRICVYDAERKRPNSLVSHRLIAEAFLGPPPTSKHQTNHKNGDRSDNRVENLEWTTCSENHLHKFRVLGARNGRSKLSIEAAREIRALYSTGEIGLVALGKMFGVSHQAIHLLVTGETWKDQSPSGKSA